jgi:RecA-family ATPase
MAIALSLGKPWSGFTVPRRSKVAYISREDTPALTRWRLRKLLVSWQVPEAELEQWMYINSRDQSPQFKLDVPEQFNEMLAALKQFGPEIVFLDVLNIMHSKDENDNTEMRKVMDKADDLSRELRCSISVLHHFNKEMKARLTERIRGASSMSGWVEWVIGLHKDKEEDDEDTLRWAEFDLKASSPPNHVYFHIQGYDVNGYKVPRGADPKEIYRMGIDRAEPPVKRRSKKDVPIGAKNRDFSGGNDD